MNKMEHAHLLENIGNLDQRVLWQVDESRNTL